MNNIASYKTKNDDGLLEKFGAEYYLPGQQAVARARPDSLYTFTSYIGKPRQTALFCAPCGER